MDSLLLSRRHFVGSVRALGLVAAMGGLISACSAAAPKPVPILVHKDPNCGCCSAWADRMESTGDFTVTLINAEDMAAVKARLRVPLELASCHTTEAAGYVIEGHVPAADILRLLREKPSDIIGLAVPGMPAGSPGMETPDGRRDAYEVIAFTTGGRQSVFARHG
jgi:hypothetical protein